MSKIRAWWRGRHRYLGTCQAFRFAIVSKDSDFAERSILEEEPPKIIWLRVGNSPTTLIEVLLRSKHEAIRIFLEEAQQTCLVLTRAS